MRSQFTWLAMLISSSLFSCSSNPSPDPTPPDPGKMPLIIQGGIASYTKASNAGFDDLDEVGIYVDNYQDAIRPGSSAREAIMPRTSSTAIMRTITVGTRNPAMKSIGKTKPPKPIYTAITLIQPQYHLYRHCHFQVRPIKVRLKTALH